MGLKILEAEVFVLLIFWNSNKLLFFTFVLFLLIKIRFLKTKINFNFGKKNLILTFLIFILWQQ